MYESRILGFGYIIPYIIGLLCFTAFPFLASFFLSFTEYNLIESPIWIGFDNFSYMFFEDELFAKSLLVTICYVALTVPLKLIFALYIAHILNYKLVGINFFRTAYYVPSILGGSVAIAVLWRYMFAEYGFINLFLDMIGITPINWFGTPGWALFTITLLRLWQFGSAMVIFLAALQSVPQSLYEAAVIDGAEKWQTFFYITMPLITPVVFFNLVMQMVQAFQEFNGPYIITRGGPLKSTYLLPLYIYESAFRHFEMGYGAALSWVLFTFVMLLTLIAFASSKYWGFYAGDKPSYR
jgi:oligogalacturonide transport system permease protein